MVRWRQPEPEPGFCRDTLLKAAGIERQETLTMIRIITPLLLLAISCVTAPTATRSPSDPPWSSQFLSPASVSPRFIEEWRIAENRATCAPLAPADLGVITGATARRANFAGGWAVAWDLPGFPGTRPDGTPCADCGRGVAGVAGTGASAAEATHQWHYQKEWEDGSRAGWGLEGGSGPRWLAYLTIPGQECLYNVWSQISREHLESLIEQLRFVRTP
jgi:hypothetical protein